MKRLQAIWRENTRWVIGCVATVAFIGWLLLNQLPTLTGGMSAVEIKTATAPVGWHGIWANPFYLPIKLVQSVIFSVAPGHGQLLSRLPCVMFGALSMVSFAWLVWQWYGRRTALLTSLLFATSAWVLHVSRLASYDVVYLWALPMLLVVQTLLHRQADKPWVWYGSLAVWGLLLYIPGLVWLVIAQIYLHRKAVLKGWQTFTTGRQRIFTIAAIAIWWPLLLWHLSRPGRFIEWIGLPTDWASPLLLLKHLAGVFVHLFIRGPQYPQMWLGRAPILDVFTLVICGLGIYFYASNWRSSRSRSLGILFILGVLLVGIGGPVGLSLLVPLLYIMAATGLAFLLRDWLKVFPNNPLARGLGIGLVAIAVSVSCLYNLRAYFIAWPHNTTTQATFRYHR
jgi:hypothetical protein